MLSMDQNPSDAAVVDAQIKFRKEEYARGTEHRWSHVDFAALRDAQIMLREEECARGTGKRYCAALKDVQTKRRKAECA